MTPAVPAPVAAAASTASVPGWCAPNPSTAGFRSASPAEGNVHPIGDVVQGDPETIEFLNEQLTAELTAINQYFLHAKMQENWGYRTLAAYTRHESIDEMHHAEMLTDRILFLEGMPNYQRLSPLRIGQTVPEQFRADLEIEVDAVTRLRAGSQHMRSVGDITSATLFETVLADEEGHIDYLETQLALLETLGEPLYLAQVTEHPSA
ncbi:MAG: bacterioferritin [Actinomycetota bacterium]|nr:bacterioferritin [Cryptosporangiaceae bacterium]MDQ1677015.1 bacterioferritin [Actinomycetota bacterium]